MTVWPTEGGSYGLDVRWGGPDGFREANAIRDAAQASDMPVKLLQDLDGRGWTVRVGPLGRDEALRVLDGFLV